MGWIACYVRSLNICPLLCITPMASWTDLRPRDKRQGKRCPSIDGLTAEIFYFDNIFQ